MALPSQNNGVTLGPTLKNQSTWGNYNETLFVIRQALSLMQTATMVRVDACTNDGGLSPVGFVDVTPLVNQVDGDGNPIPHVTVYGLPYMRMQGGTDAVILDPKIGDLGFAVFASRDISKVKSTKAQANPGSARKYDFADGIYVGGLLNGVPTRYVRFATDGIVIHAPDSITLESPSIILKGAVTQSDGDVTIAENLTVSGDVTAEGTSLHTHRHTSSAIGTPTSVPIP